MKTGGSRGLDRCCNDIGDIESYYFHWNRSEYDVLFECLTGINLKTLYLFNAGAVLLQYIFFQSVLDHNKALFHY